MVDNGRIALDDAVNIQVASKPRIGQFFILEAPDGGFNGLGGSRTGLEEAHANAGSTGRNMLAEAAQLAWDDLLCADLEVDSLVCHTVIACACVDEDHGNWLLRLLSAHAVNSAVPLGRDGLGFRRVRHDPRRVTASRLAMGEARVAVTRGCSGNLRCEGRVEEQGAEGRKTVVWCTRQEVPVSTNTDRNLGNPMESQDLRREKVVVRPQGSVSGNKLAAAVTYTTELHPASAVKCRLSWRV